MKKSQGLVVVHGENVLSLALNEIKRRENAIKQLVEMLGSATGQDEVDCQVLKPFGYHDNHEVGEIIPVQLQHVGTLLTSGHISIHRPSVAKSARSKPYLQVVEAF